MKIIYVLEAAGILIIPMFIWGSIALSLIVDKWVQLKKGTQQLSVLNSILNQIEQKTIENMDDIEKKKRKTVIEPFLTCIIKFNHTHTTFFEKELINTISNIEDLCEKKLSTIQIMGNLFPMIGLLGTVMGMIKMFDALAIFGTGNMAVIAGGISEALLTTQIGLVSALPILFIHNYLSNNKDHIITELEYAKNKLIRYKTEPKD